MRWFTTIFLIALVACGVLWLAFGDWARRTLGVAAATEASSATFVALRDQIKPESLKRIERTLPGGESMVLTRAADGEWTQPGNWPVRQSDANELAASLADLKTRFQPIPLQSGADLKTYGLDPAQKPVVVRLDAAAKTLTLTFGQAPDAKGSAFGRSTYLRLDDQPEVLRLGPDAYAAVTKPGDAYRRRQLFPDATRLKLTGGEPPPNPMAPPPPPGGRVLLPTDKVAAIKVESAAGGFAIKRTTPTPVPSTDPDRPSAEPTLSANRVAAAWELAEAAEADKPGLKPLRDHVDPAKLRTLLTAIPDLWAEQFVTGKSETETGLDKPLRTLQLTFTNGSAATLRIGKLARRTVRDASAPPPANPFQPQPPPPQPKIEEYYYAKLDNNPLVFEIRGEKFNEIFTAADEMRDAQLARFESGDVSEFTVAVKGQPPIKITKKKANKDAEKDDDRQDRWYIGDRLAETSKVTELLDALAKLEARGKEERIDDADAKKLADLGFDPASTKVTITTDKAGVKAETVFVIGKDETEKKKLNVQVAGWPRVNVVADDVLKLIDRPALAYRGRRLFDTAEAKLTGLTVTPATGDAFALKQDAEKKWQIVSPVAMAADETKAAQMTGDLSRLEVTEYVDDAPKPEDLEKKYGLAKPRLAVKLAFEGKPEATLEVGHAPEFKPEVYAKLAGTSSVFTLPKEKIDALTSGAAGLLPLQLWGVPADKLSAVEIQRANGEKYKLAADAGNWKLTGPFEAPVPFLVAQGLLNAASNVKAEKYETISAADLAKFGLDKPIVKIGVTFREPKGEKEETITKTIAIGTAPADNPAMRYAMLEGSKAVFVLPDAMAKEADKPALDRLDKTLYTLDPLSIEKVVIAAPTPEASSTLVRDKQVWKAEGKPYAVDQLSISALQNAAARPAGVRLAAYGTNLNLAEFGLDKPAYTITINLVDGKSHVIKLGKAAPEGGRFARADDGPAIAVLSPPATNALTRTPLEFVDRALLSFEPGQIAGIVRKEGNETLEITPGATLGWDIVQPAKQKGDQILLDDLIDQLSRLRAASVAAYAPEDLHAFGLVKPFATLLLKVGLEKPEEKQLKIGNETDEGKTGDRYVTLDGKTIGVLPAALVERITAAPLKFRDRTLAKFVDADRATLVRGDRTVTFAKVNGTWKLVKPLTADAEQAELDELINSVAKLRADELAAEKPASLKPYGLDKPEAIWTFASGDNDVLKILLGGRDKSGQRVYAKTDGSDTVALLDPGLTTRLFNEYRKRSVWSGVDAAQIETVAISSGSVNFGLRKQGNVWVDTERPGEPVNTAAVTELLDALAGLKAARYVVDEKADLKLYGLEPPQRVIVITQKGSVKTLHLGREEGGNSGRVYARVADKDRTEVFVLSEADTAKLMKDRAAFAAKK